MKKSIIHIKNMVCPRCILTIEGLLHELHIQFESVELGQIVLQKPIDTNQLLIFENRIKAVGFELLETGKSTIISDIKTVIIDQIHHKKEPTLVNFSSVISEKLHHEYTYLSRLFSSVEGITIEKFIALQKTERVKEFLMYNQMTLSEIANDMNYSSVAHLSAQFKKETGMTPTQFKAQGKPKRNPLDNLQSE